MDRRLMFMKRKKKKKKTTTGIVCQIYWCIIQISGERLQEHWSSGLDLQSLSQATNRNHYSMILNIALILQYLIGFLFYDGHSF